MKKNETRKPKVQKKSKEVQFEKTESGQQGETVGKIIYNYIKTDIDRKT